MATTKVRLYQLVRLMVDELALRYKAKVSSWISRAKFLSNGHFSTFTFFQPFKVHTLLVKEFHDMMRAFVNNYCVTRRKAYVIILRSLLQNWLVKMQSMPGNITSLWLVAFVNSKEKKLTFNIRAFHGNWTKKEKQTNTIFEITTMLST